MSSLSKTKTLKNEKAPSNSPTFTGTVNLGTSVASGSVTTALNSASLGGLPSSSYVQQSNLSTASVAYANNSASLAGQPGSYYSAASSLDAKISSSIVTAKGDLLVGLSSSSIGRLGVGTDGYILTASSTASGGMAWAAAAAGGGTSSGLLFSAYGSTASVGSINDHYFLMTGGIFDNNSWNGQIYKKTGSTTWSTGDVYGGYEKYYVIALPTPLTKSPSPGWQWQPGYINTSATATNLNIKNLTTNTSTGYSASVAGTSAGLGLINTISDPGGLGTFGNLAFVSAYFTLNALPETGKIATFGQIMFDGTYIEGIGVEVTSSGTYSIKVYDAYGGANSTIVAGGTGVSVSDRIYYERFGKRITAARIATGTGSYASSITGIIPEVTGYAGFFARAALGFYTDSSSVRIVNPTWYG